jgi:hypothetical protein
VIVQEYDFWGVKKVVKPALCFVLSKGVNFGSAVNGMVDETGVCEVIGAGFGGEIGCVEVTPYDCEMRRMA